LGRYKTCPYKNILKTETYQNLTISALDRLRVQQFGAEPLKLSSMTPETGEAEVAEYATGWGGHRVVATTESGTAESGAWQFQIKAEGDQAYMSKIVSLRVGARRWKVKKVEAPAGNSLVWKIKAEIQ
jgi:hypothetical protein